MFKNIYLMICLILLSYKDIKSRSVPVIWLILIGAGIPVIYVYDYMINGNVPDYIRLIIAAVIMALLVVVSLFTSLIGEADGIIIGYVCFLMDVYAAVTAVLISFVLLAISYSYIFLHRKLLLSSQQMTFFIIPITLLCAVVDTTSSTIMVCRQAYLQDLAYETTPSREKTTFSAMVMNTISAMKMYVSSTNTTESAILKKTDV